MTIDGVANIDTGDNGGNMATTNIDAVAEFKILTNAYQAEYGRAVGGQLQVVTKSGTQHFHGSGYWYGRRSDWNANSWINNARQRRSDARRPATSRNDCGYTIGGPVFIPGFNTEKKKLFFFWSQEFQRRTQPDSLASRRACRPRSSAQGDFSQSVDSSGNPFPYIRDYTTGLPCSAADTSAAASRTAACSAGSRRTASTRPASHALNIFPQANFSGGGGLNFKSQDRRQRAASRGPAAHRLPGDRQLARHRPLHEHEGEHPAGLRHDLGRQRQRPAPDADAVPAPGLRTTCCRRPASSAPRCPSR